MDRSYSGSGTLQPSLTPRSGPVPLRWHRSHHRTEQVFSDSGARRRAGDTSETPWWGRAAAAGVGLVAGAAACETVIGCVAAVGGVQVRYRQSPARLIRSVKAF